ncbi:uncharacterized protein LOC144435645 [Glandiceps talaboti]
MSKLITSLKRRSWRRNSSTDSDDSSYNLKMGDEVFHEGFLEKKTGVGVIKSTKKHWFQLQSRELKYYKTNPKWEPSNPKGAINIADLQTVKAMSMQHRHFVQIITQKERFSLFGESASYCEEWVTKLHQAMQRLRQSTVSVCAPGSPPTRGKSMRQNLAPLMEEGDQAAKRNDLEYELLDGSSGTGSGETIRKNSEDIDAAKTNNLEYELLDGSSGTGSGETVRKDWEDIDASLYEEIQPVKNAAPSTVKKSPTSRQGREQTGESDSNSSGYYSMEGTPTDQDVDEVFGNTTPPPLPKLPPRKIKSPAMEELRQLLTEMGADIVNSVDTDAQGESNGIEEVRQFIRARFSINV